MNDEGSAFWLGQKAYQKVLKDLDDRGSKTLMTNLFFKKFKAKSAGDLKRKIYLKDNLIKNVSFWALLVDKAAQRGDKIARDILTEAGKELALGANTVIKKLDFQKSKFPLVLVGGTFNSKIVLNRAKKDIKKVAPQIEFVLLKSEPVRGAIKLAIEQLKGE